MNEIILEEQKNIQNNNKEIIKRSNSNYNKEDINKEENNKDEIIISSSVYIIGYISFIGDMSRGVIFPVLWKLTSTLSGNLTDLGYLIACFSFGRMFFGPILGYISDKYSHKLSLLIASCLLILGSILWSFTYLTNTLYFLFISQFLLGCGSGSLGVTRAYIVETCPKKRLTEILAYMNSLQFAGFTVSPIFGSGLSYLGVLMKSQFLQFFLPSISIAFSALLSLYFLLFIFKDHKPDDNLQSYHPAVTEMIPITTQNQENIIQSVVEDIESTSFDSLTRLSSNSIIDDQTPILTVPSSSESSSFKINISDKLKLILKNMIEKCSFNISNMAMSYLVLIIVNVTARGSIAVYETMTPQIADTIYNMSTVHLGMIVSILGCVGTLQLIFFKFIWTPTGLNDIQLMSIGLVVMATASYIIFDYEYELKTKPEGYVPFWRFIFSMILVYSIGYPIAQTSVLSAFSKMKKHGAQGQLQSWFATAGSISRIILPITSGYIEIIETNGTFSVVLCLLSLAMITLLIKKDIISEFIFTIDEKKKSYNETILQQYIDRSILCMCLVSVGFSCWALAGIHHEVQTWLKFGRPNMKEIFERKTSFNQ